MDDFRIIRNNVRNYFNLEYTTHKQNAIQHFRERKKIKNNVHLEILVLVIQRKKERVNASF